MSDERLRETQRLVALGDEDARARELLLRARAGALASDQLELLACAGHEPACRALGRPTPGVPEDLEAWVHELGRWGRPTEVVAATAAARLVLPTYEAARPGDGRPRRALEAAERWLARAADVVEMTTLLEDAAAAAREAAAHTAQRAGWACYYAGATAYGWEPRRNAQAGLAAFEALLVLRDPVRLRDTIRDRLVAWVLETT